MDVSDGKYAISLVHITGEKASTGIFGTL